MFLPGNSVIHRMDARVKLAALLIAVVAVVCTDTLIGYGVMILFTAVLVRLSGIGFSAAFGSVRRLGWFFAFILLMNTCFYGPDGAWFTFWIFSPSPAGLMQGLNVVLRVLLVLVLSNVMTAATAPLEITKALERLMSPLKYVGLPVEQIAMIISVAIQFIPTLFEETDMIRKAQTARGARFDSPKLSQKAAAVMPLAVPIFLSAFRRADELAEAMEARGYRGAKGRTKKKYASLKWTDYAALACVSVICAVQIVFA
jgi:energy-coupling factor transport system permease protein